MVINLLWLHCLLNSEPFRECWINNYWIKQYCVRDELIEIWFSDGSLKRMGAVGQPSFVLGKSTVLENLLLRSLEKCPVKFICTLRKSCPGNHIYTLNSLLFFDSLCDIKINVHWIAKTYKVDQSNRPSKF